MSPVFCLKCPECMTRVERASSWESIHERLQNEELLCPNCGTPMKRDYAAESPMNTFHPTRDLYAEKLRKKPVKNPYVKG